MYHLEHDGTIVHDYTVALRILVERKDVPIGHETLHTMSPQGPGREGVKSNDLKPRHRR